MTRQVTRKASRDLAHDQALAARRYEQLAGIDVRYPSSRSLVEQLESGELSGIPKAELWKRLGAPEWSKLYKALDQPTADSWTDWHVRRRVQADVRRTEISTRMLEHFQDHVDTKISAADQAWLEGAAWREIQRLAPGKLSTVMGLTRALLAIARDPNFLLRLVEPRALRWAQIAFRVAKLSRASRTKEKAPEVSREVSRERDGGIEL